MKRPPGAPEPFTAIPERERAPMAKIRLIISIVMTTIAALALVSLLFIEEGDESNLIKNATVLSPPRPTGSFQLIDHEGTPVNNQALVGQWSVVGLGFAHCPDVCPAALATMKRELEVLGKSEKRSEVQFIFIGIDPDRDSPEAFGKFVKQVHPDIKAWTGSKDQLKVFTRKIGAYFGAAKDAPMVHTTSFFLLNPKGEWTGLYHVPLKTGQLAADLDRLLTSRGRTFF